MFNQDLHIYTRTFGKDIAFVLANGSSIAEGSDGKPLKGIFDNAYYLKEIGDIDIDSTQPRLMCVESDVVKVKKEDSVTIDGIAYDVVRNPQSDGTGMVVIPLAKQGKF